MNPEQHQPPDAYKRPAVPQAVKILPRYDMSLAQVLAAKQQGHEILYTPHVGNKWREDIFLALHGIRHATVNRNAIGIDDIDQPHNVRLDGMVHPIVSGQHGVLTPFAAFSPEEQAAAHALAGPHGATPAQLHFNSALAALPEGTVDLEDEVLFLRGGAAHKVADLLGSASRAEGVTVFSRQVLDGKAGPGPERKDAGALQAFLDLAAKTVQNIREGRSDSAEGPLPANSAMIGAILLHALYAQRENGLMRNGKADVYTVSGPVMITFIRQFTDHINAFYHAAREADPSLPAQVDYHVIPGAVFDFVPVPSEREACELVAGILDLEEQREDVGNALRQKACADRTSLIARKHQLGGEQDALVARFLSLRDGLPFFSQYDMLKSGELLASLPGLQKIQFRRIQQLFHHKQK